jgi:effector-binding domain-containing protein
MDIEIETVAARRIAAVRRRLKITELGRGWKAALDEVWSFLRAHPGLRAGGHNVFVYHHPAKRNDPMDVDFGVEVAQPFEPEGEIILVETPAGEVARAVHVGPYDRMKETHEAIHRWSERVGRRFAGISWEVYGDWNEDPSKLETTIRYALAP